MRFALPTWTAADRTSATARGDRGNSFRPYRWTSRRRQTARVVSKNRLEAFSDGVFAIVITLLVIEIRPPQVAEDQSLAAALWHLWPSYLAYFVSFLVIGVMWLNHHRMFERVRQVDGALLVLNLNLLLWTVLIPFPTAVVAEYLRDGGEHASSAMALYSALILVTALSFVALFTWITHDERLVAGGAPVNVQGARRRFSIGLVAYTIAFAVSWAWPVGALALHAAMALYYAFDQATIATRTA
jgi:uncharacterized membrane protein